MRRRNGTQVRHNPHHDPGRGLAGLGQLALADRAEHDRKDPEYPPSDQRRAQQQGGDAKPHRGGGLTVVGGNRSGDRVRRVNGGALRRVPATVTTQATDQALAGLAVAGRWLLWRRARLRRRRA